MDNAAPAIFSGAQLAAEAAARRASAPPRVVSADDEDLLEEIYNFLRSIRDPEHPHTLEQLAVVYDGCVCIEHLPGRRVRIDVQFCPTVPHCSLATIIGLCIRVKLLRFFPHAKIDIAITPGRHQTEHEINRQINDKERVAAALENPQLRELVDKLIAEPEY